MGATPAVIGVGARNTFNHPHPAVLADLERVRVLRTDAAGTLTGTVRPQPRSR